MDVGATLTRVTLRHLPLEEWSRAVPVRRFATPADPAALAAAIAGALGALAGVERIQVVGIAAPGPLDPQKGTIVNSPNLDWRDIPLGPLVGAATGARWRLEDDANAGAFGEARLGAGVGADPVIYLTVSTGIGAGIVVGGRLVRGAHDVAGEVGHLMVDPSGPRCTCGGRGHVEAYAGGAGLARRARRAWPAAWLADGTPAPRDAAAVLRRWRAGDPVARALINDAVEALAQALAALAAVVDPAVVVVGGSIGLGQAALIRAAVSRARSRPIREAGRALVVVRAALAADSPLAGAAILASEDAAHESGHGQAGAGPEDAAR